MGEGGRNQQFQSRQCVYILLITHHSLHVQFEKQIENKQKTLPRTKTSKNQ